MSRFPTASARSRRTTIEQRTIVDTYLDTADLALREGGGRLRIRVQNGRRLSTFKRSLEGPADGVRRREEIEGPADGDPGAVGRLPGRARAQQRAARARRHAPHRAHRPRVPLRLARRRGGHRPPALPGRQRGDPRRGRGRRGLGRGVLARAGSRRPGHRAGHDHEGRGALAPARLRGTRGGIRTRTPFGSRV